MRWIAPSLLAADFADLAGDVRLVEEAGARILHLDVMDGHFVPNLTFGPPVIRAVRKRTQLVLDVHLMISNAESSFLQYLKAGADLLTVHVEAVTHLDRLLTEIQKRGAKPGVALNPHTPLAVLEEILPKCHHVLVMSVNPGFGGQRFISTSFEKVRKLREMIRSRKLDVKIEIDGGIGPHNTREAVDAGVNLVVAGSAIFRSERPAETFQQMQGLVDRMGVS